MVQRRSATGIGRLLVALYALFALAATSRAAVQIIRDFDAAPIAYSLSALAAVVYIVATISIARGAHRIAWAACLFELVGVLTVGILSLIDRQWFPDDTVWSRFGSGYLFIPLVLPILGLIYLRRVTRTTA